MQKEGIAIIGIWLPLSGRRQQTRNHFGNCSWKAVRRFLTCLPTAGTWSGFTTPSQGTRGKDQSRSAGRFRRRALISSTRSFPAFRPREAPYVDPQHRLLLETAWEAMEDAGVVLDLDRGTDIGVFVGISHNDYQGIQGTPGEHSGISPHSPTGSAHSIAANRISYCFNLRGPSVAMDTACSSALTAVHVACEHIWSGRGEAALAGGVTIIITPGGFIGFSQASMLSPDGSCKAFDASGRMGFVPRRRGGNGAAQAAFQGASRTAIRSTA